MARFKPGDEVVVTGIDGYMSEVFYIGSRWTVKTCDEDPAGCMRLEGVQAGPYQWKFEHWPLHGIPLNDSLYKDAMMAIEIMEKING